MIKSNKEFFLKSQQQLIVRLMKLLDWVLECEKKVHRAETDSWYLNWKVDYLEKKLKEMKVPLYSEDDSEVENLMKNKKINGKEGTKYD